MNRWLFTHAITISIFGTLMLLSGCASSVTPILKYPMLGDDEAYATITMKKEFTGPRTFIAEFIVSDASGDKQAYLPVDKDSMGTNTLKLAYALTPWGMATMAANSNKGAIYHVPSKKMDIKFSSEYMEGPIDSYVEGDTKYTVWKVYRWSSYIRNMHLKVGEKYFIHAPQSLFGEPTLVNPERWSVISEPALEVKDTSEEEITLDEAGKKAKTQ